VVEQVAFLAREDKRVDKRSGVSQRLPISTLELVISSAERRALVHGESVAVARVGDLYTAMPGITGKLELEYEGEMKGADAVAREIVRQAVKKVFDKEFGEVNTQQVEQWFNLGGTVRLGDAQASAVAWKELEAIQGLKEKLKPLGVAKDASAAEWLSAAEFLLEGMYAHKRLSRNEERGFSAAERMKQDAKSAAEKSVERRERETVTARERTRRGFN